MFQLPLIDAHCPSIRSMQRRSCVGASYSSFNYGQSVWLWGLKSAKRRLSFLNCEGFEVCKSHLHMNEEASFRLKKPLKEMLRNLLLDKQPVLQVLDVGGFEGRCEEACLNTRYSSCGLFWIH
ncbi:MAG: hypothetical protein QXL22_03380 [Candidatus Nezhaarchaeales archaeon]